MIIEMFEHVLPATTRRTDIETWINQVAKPNMAMAGYKLIRWCWVDVDEPQSILISIGEHETVDSLKQVWRSEKMLAARDQFYHLFPEAKVNRRILNVIKE